MVAAPQTVCRGGQVRRCHASCGVCGVPRAEELRDMLRSAYVVSEQLAKDTRLIGVEIHEPPTLGAPQPRLSRVNGNCCPARMASSTRWRRRAVAVSTNSLLEDRARAQHLMRRAHEDVGSRFFTANSWAKDANSWNKSQRPAPRQETNNHWISSALSV